MKASYVVECLPCNEILTEKDKPDDAFLVYHEYTEQCPHCHGPSRISLYLTDTSGIRERVAQVQLEPGLQFA